MLNFEKWEIYEVITGGLNSASEGYVKSIFPRGVVGALTRT